MLLQLKVKGIEDQSTIKAKIKMKMKQKSNPKAVLYKMKDN